MRILITGVTGFAGGHLVEHLEAALEDPELYGLAWGPVGPELLRTLGPRIHLMPGDVCHPPSLRQAIETSQPAFVFHLAAASSVSGSWSQAADTFEVNALGTVHLLEAIRECGIAPKVVMASSADVYGTQGDGRATLPEELPLRPTSPYGASKAALELVASQYFAGAGLATIRLRLFNHTGPRRPANFVASSLARQIAQIEAGGRDPVLRVGDLDIVRDFTDVRDVARAYRLAASLAEPGEVYNVCSGRPVSVRELLTTLLDIAGLDAEVRPDPTFGRAGEIRRLVGDPSRFASATGWRAEIPLSQTLADLLDWWRQALATS